jgi:hypothetical protein
MQRRTQQEWLERVSHARFVSFFSPQSDFHAHLPGRDAGRPVRYRAQGRHTRNAGAGQRFRRTSREVWKDKDLRSILVVDRFAMAFGGEGKGGGGGSARGVVQQRGR